MTTSKPKNRPPVPEAFVERCRELGLLTWRLDLNGMPVEDPGAPELLALWMSSKPFRSLLTDQATEWAAQPAPGAVNPVPGVWLFPFEELHRRRRTGYFIAIGFGEAIHDSALLDPGSVGGSLQLGAVRHLLAEHTVLTDLSAAQVGRNLSWMHSDLVGTCRSDETIEGFTEQLAVAYETVTMLCDLGRGMGAIDDPMSFVSTVGEQIANTLQYRWVGITVERAGQPLMISQHGPSRLEAAEVASILERVRHEVPAATAGSTGIYGVDQHDSVLAPQVVVHPIERASRRFGYMLAGGKMGSDPQVSTYETKSFESICGLLAAFLENVELYDDQRATFIGTIRAMSGALDAKDRYTRGHSDRVAYLSAEIARAVGFRPEEVERVRIAGLVHDVGKIGVPEAVLCKPGCLTDEEFKKIKLHPQIGYDILKDIPSLRDILPGVLHHHERYDGRGYPHGLSGEDIPLIARIIGVADTFDAMSSNRAYRSKMAREVVLAEIDRCAGTQFDPNLANAFLTLDLSEYDRMVANHAAQDLLSRAA